MPPSARGRFSEGAAKLLPAATDSRLLGGIGLSLSLAANVRRGRPFVDPFVPVDVRSEIYIYAVNRVDPYSHLSELISCGLH